jgi:transposase
MTDIPGRVSWILSPITVNHRVVITRHDLADEQWEGLESLFPAEPGPGQDGRWADDRRTVNGILFRTRKGCPLRDLPGEDGHWLTVYKTHRRWSCDGTWAQILGCGRGPRGGGAGLDGERGFDRSPDPSACGLYPPRRSHGPGHEWYRRVTRTLAARRAEALGRSRGGLTTKVHLFADRRCMTGGWQVIVVPSALR